MRVSSISVSQLNSRMPKAKFTNYQSPETTPQIANDSVTFKGIKNAARAGGLYGVAGLLVGAVCLPALGPIGGAALLGTLIGAVGAIRGAMENDKKNILDQTEG